MGGGSESVGGALGTLPQFLVFLQQVFRAGQIAVRTDSSGWHKFRGSSRVRNTRVLLDRGHEEKATGLDTGRGDAPDIAHGTPVNKIVCQAQFVVNGKCNRNYPSVAKACTFAASLTAPRPRFIEANKKRTIRGELPVSSVGFAVGGGRHSGFCSWFPTRFCPIFGPSGAPDGELERRRGLHEWSQSGNRAAKVGQAAARDPGFCAQP